MADLKKIYEQKENKSMKQYQEFASDIIKNVGGKGNIQSVRHCYTRLRFRLEDEGKANEAALKELKGVITIMKAAGEFMVVVGEQVPFVYEEVCSQIGFHSQEKEEGPEEKEKTGILNRIMQAVMGAMSPLLNMLCACGIIKGLLVVFGLLGLSADSGVYMLLNAAGDCIFYFLPLVLGYNLAKHMRMDPVLGLLIGAALCYPTINGVDLNVLGYTLNVSYTNSFLPIMLAISLAAPLYRGLTKVLPNVIKGIFAPLITLLIIFPLAFLVVGPIANVIGSWISVAMNASIDTVPFLAAPLFAGVWQVMVLFGVHNIPGVLAMMDLSAGNPNTPIAIMILPAFAQIGVVLAVYLKTNDKKLKSIALPAFASGIFGITEPAIYGVTLPRMKMFVISCIGAAVSGLCLAIFGLKAYTYSGLGIIGLLGLLNPEHPQVLAIILCAVSGFAAAFLLAFAMYKEEPAAEENLEDVPAAELKDKAERLAAPADGVVKPVSECSDEAFACEGLGKGVVVYPADGEVCAPCDGVVTALFPTGHAIGIKSDHGCELLIHIGINTVELNGKYFEAKVEQGARVKQGEVLVTFDKDAVEREGYSTEIPVIVTNTADYTEVLGLMEGEISRLEPVLEVK